ncbi:hypothetical protein [Pseudomonas nitroreducens]|uniref:hypothetical protein n=1 Tax=Pseudomonas nitroreducens TaxID=46680 RepID=UPI0011309272|nr:hypothetical protein [Pseudomonas nitroreducens]
MRLQIIKSLKAISLLMLLCATTVGAATEELGDRKYIYSFEPFKKHSIHIRLNGDIFYFRENDGPWKIIKKGVLPGGKAAPVLFLDANKDGMKDA